MPTTDPAWGWPIAAGSDPVKQYPAAVDQPFKSQLSAQLAGGTVRAFADEAARAAALPSPVAGMLTVLTAPTVDPQTPYRVEQWTGSAWRSLAGREGKFVGSSVRSSALNLTADVMTTIGWESTSGSAFLRTPPFETDFRVKAPYDGTYMLTLHLSLAAGTAGAIACRGNIMLNSSAFGAISPPLIRHAANTTYPKVTVLQDVGAGVKIGAQIAAAAACTMSSCTLSLYGPL